MGEAAGEKGVMQTQEEQSNNASAVRWQGFLPRMVLKVLLVEANVSTRELRSRENDDVAMEARKKTNTNPRHGSGARCQGVLHENAGTVRVMAVAQGIGIFGLG
ncbi:two-component response regulator APRR5 [Spatholobus suberectus]|nr:two-component response regulator APRR5 [Spatholobus suberectus]